MQKTLDRILDAHGGLDYWQSLSRLEVEASVGGLLLTTKRIPPQRHIHLSVNTQRPELVMHNYPVRGQRALFEGESFIQIQEGAGQVVQARTGPRAAFRRLRRQFFWDNLDFAYFCGYAMWNYLTMPFLFLHQGVQVEVAGDDSFPGGAKLTVSFPPEFPTHCPVQTFYFDAQYHLRRHDYTAQVVGGWATAAHLCDEYRQFGGLWLPTRRRVYPKLVAGTPIRQVTLVAIDIHDVIPVL